MANATKTTPVERVTTLIENLKTSVEEDGVKEQDAYNKFACYTEDTMDTTSAAIKASQDSIKRLTESIEQLSGEIGVLTIDVAQLKKDIAANIKAQEEATAVRQKKHNAFYKAEEDRKLATAATKKAADVLHKATRGSLLEESDAMSMATSMRSAMRTSVVKNLLDDEETAVLRKFADAPFHAKAFLQSSNNPFGDYAPASTQIQGILKNMFDAFASDSEAELTQEGNQQKMYEELMALKKRELVSLKTTLGNKELTLASKTKQKADEKQERQQTEVVLATDEDYYAEVKAAGQEKADQWAERTRLRTEELAGFGQALAILKDPKNTSIFDDSYKNTGSGFLQVQSTDLTQMSRIHGVNRALNSLKNLATKSKSLRLATLAVSLRMTSKSGNAAFDQVKKAIVDMIATLEDEMKSDVKDKEQCKLLKTGNSGDLTTINNKMEDLETEKSRAQNDLDKINDKIAELEADITSTKGELKTATDLRVDENTNFKKLMKDDTDAVALLQKALSALTAFAKNNGLSLAQLEQPAAVERKEVPSTWKKGGKYGGRSSESSGIVAIMEMIIADVEAEMSEARKTEAESLKVFNELKASLLKAIAELNKTKTLKDKEAAARNDQLTRIGDDLSTLEEAKTANGDDKQALEEKCAWIATNFEKRKTNRANEIAGCREALSYLSGASSDSNLANASGEGLSTYIGGDGDGYNVDTSLYADQY